MIHPFILMAFILDLMSQQFFLGIISATVRGEGVASPYLLEFEENKMECASEQAMNVNRMRYCSV